MSNTDPISKYVTYGEATQSQTGTRLGIDNTPNDEQLLAMKYVAREIFDKVREFVGGPVMVGSFFRCKELNDVIGGSSSTSQHMKGEAIDIVRYGMNRYIFQFIKDNLEFDQLIWEYGTTQEPDWVHCSKVSNGKNRGQILRCVKGANGPIYSTY